MQTQAHVTLRRPGRRGLPPARRQGTMKAVDLPSVLARAKRGDETARAELIDRFYPSVSEMVHRELALDMRRGRPWLAALFSTGDVVHDVFVGVLRDLDDFQGRDERAFEGFLAKTVTHRLLDTIRFHEAARRDGRRVGRVRDPHSVDAPSDATSPTNVAARHEEADAVQSAIATLGERDRDLLEMRFRREATYAQIAAALDIPSEDAARKAVRAAQARLMVKLRARGLD